MRIKLPQNRFQQPPIEVNKKQSNINLEHEPMEPKPKPAEPFFKAQPKLQLQPNQVIGNENQKQKALKYREKQLSQDVATRRDKMRGNNEPVMEGFEDTDNAGNFNDIMNKISMMDLPRQYKMNPDETVRNYLKTEKRFTQTVLNLQMEQNTNVRVNDGSDKSNDYDYYDTQAKQRYMQSMRRNWNSNNRGIRSDDDFDRKEKCVWGLSCL